MRILVAHNFHLLLDPHETAEMRPYAPVGTVAIASDLKRRGYQVVVDDCTFRQDPGGFSAVLDQHNPDVVLLIADHHSILQKMCLGEQRRAAATMIGLARDRGCKVLAAGPDMSDEPAVYLNAGAHAVIRGEPDRPVVRWLAGEQEVPGLMEPGDPLAAPAPAMPLDDLTPPDWSLLDLSAYARAWRSKHGFWEAAVSAARGCPYRCNWCAKPVWGRGLTLRPPAAVVADCRDLAARGADRIWFMDDIFALKPSWLRLFRAAVDDAGGILPYRMQARADLAAKEAYVDDLAATGCVEVWMGAESGSDSVLRAMDKDATVQQIVRANELLQSRGIRTGFFLQLGYPGEGWSEVQQTLKMVRDAMPDHIGISVSYPLPGTVFYDNVRDQLSDTHWDTAMDNAVLHTAAFEQPFYRATRQALRREHAVRRAPAEVRAWMGGHGDLRMAAKRVLTAPKHLALLPLAHAQMRWWARVQGADLNR